MGKDFKLEEWTPPNPVLHEMAFLKRLNEVDRTKATFCLTRWLNINYAESEPTIHVKHFPMMSNHQKYEKPTEFPFVIILKMFFPLYEGFTSKRVEQGFVAKGKSHPRIGVFLPEQIYISVDFPKVKGSKELTQTQKNFLLKKISELNLMTYFPSRAFRKENILGPGDMYESITNLDDFRLLVFLTQKNWKIEEKPLDINKYKLFIKYANLDWVKEIGYYTPERIVELKRKDHHTGFENETNWIDDFTVEFIYHYNPKAGI